MTDQRVRQRVFAINKEEVLTPNRLEKIVMQSLLAGEHPVLQILAKQFEKATVVKRDETGAGFFTYFDVPSDVPRLEQRSLRFGDVSAQIDGLENGAGFVLFVKNGTIDFLEGYSFDEPWPMRIDGFTLS